MDVTPTPDDLRDILSRLLGDVPYGSWINLTVDTNRRLDMASHTLAVRLQFPACSGIRNGEVYTQAPLQVANDLVLTDKVLISLRNTELKSFLLGRIEEAVWQMQSHIWLRDPRIGTEYGELPKCPLFDPPKLPQADKCPICGWWLGPEHHTVVWESAVIGWVHETCL